jgi:chaperonin cofactor prefoldin
MTFIGKFLVFVLVILAFIQLSWVVVVTATPTQVDWTEVKEKDESLPQRIKTLEKGIAEARASYTKLRAPIQPAETRVAKFKKDTDDKLKEAKTGKFYDFMPDKRTLDLRSIITIKAVTQDPKRPGVRDLPGVETLQKEFTDSAAQGAKDTMEIGELEKERALHVDETIAFNKITFRMKDLLRDYLQQGSYLKDNRINWEAQYATLKKRNDQLAARLKELEAVLVGRAPLEPSVPIVAKPDQR